MTRFLIPGLLLLGCRGEAPDMLEDIAQYHLTAYDTVDAFGEGALVIGGPGALAGEAALDIVSDGSSTDIVVAYADAGLRDGARWSGDSHWTVASSEHTLAGELIIDGEALDLALEMWPEEDGAGRIAWRGAGTLGGEVLDGVELGVIREPDTEDSWDDCRAAVGVDCD